MSVRSFAALCAVLFCTSAASAAVPNVQVSDLAFLTGRWTTGNASGPATSLKGQMEFKPAADGQSVMMHDKASFVGPGGADLGGIDYTFRIWREGDSLHGEYVDAEHTLHYRLVSMKGAQAMFESDPAHNGAVLRLGFELTGPRELKVTHGFKGESQPQFGETTETLNKADR